jgi:hypothetical protein
MTMKERLGASLPPSGYTYNTDKVKNLLAGTYKFTPNEVETFYLNI